jgi:hypothetical protein
MNNHYKTLDYLYSHFININDIYITLIPSAWQKVKIREWREDDYNPT